MDAGNDDLVTLPGDPMPFKTYFAILRTYVKVNS